MVVLFCELDQSNDGKEKNKADVGHTRPVFIFFGGMVQIFGAVGEWILGNTFSCALFFTYGIFPTTPHSS